MKITCAQFGLVLQGAAGTEGCARTQLSTPYYNQRFFANDDEIAWHRSARRWWNRLVYKMLSIVFPWKTFWLRGDLNSPSRAVRALRATSRWLCERLQFIVDSDGTATKIVNIRIVGHDGKVRNIFSSVEPLHTQTFRAAFDLADNNLCFLLNTLDEIEVTVRFERAALWSGTFFGKQGEWGGSMHEFESEVGVWTKVWRC